MNRTLGIVEVLACAGVALLLALEASRWWMLKWRRISEAVELLRSSNASLKSLSAG